MALTEPAEQNLLQQFYADLASNGDQILHIRKNGNTLSRITRRQAASEVSQFIRALYAHGVPPESRVTFQAPSDYPLWIAEWGVLASHCAPVIVPENFNIAELLSILAESKSVLVIIDRLATAQAIAEAAVNLPDLKQIICFEGNAQSHLPIVSWDSFFESGTQVADRTGATIRSIIGKSTAILFYYKDEKGNLQATRYTHQLLLKNIQKIDELLGNSATIHKGETVLALTTWGQAIGHMVSYYLPVLKLASVQIASKKSGPGILECRPHVLIGRGMDLEILKQDIVDHVKQQGPGARKELNMALAMGRIKYESGKLNPWQRLGHTLLRQTIFKEVQEFLGGRLRLFISVDDAVRYETQLFFETFGIELVELPPEVIKP